MNKTTITNDIFIQLDNESTLDIFNEESQEQTPSNQSTKSTFSETINDNKLSEHDEILKDDNMSDIVDTGTDSESKNMTASLSSPELLQRAGKENSQTTLEKHVNITYNLWCFGEFNVLIRCKRHGFVFDSINKVIMPNSNAIFVTTYPLLIIFISTAFG